jgi:hypothetical protein
MFQNNDVPYGTHCDAATERQYEDLEPSEELTTEGQQQPSLGGQVFMGEQLPRE